MTRTALIVSLLLWVGLSHASPVTLTYTLPAFHSDGADSGGSCAASAEPLTTLSLSRLWYWPVSGGQPFILRQHDVTGREAQPDTFQTDTANAGHYWITTRTMSGLESCPSNTVYLGLVTAVEDPLGLLLDPVVRRQTFDVQGRRVGPLASGVYFERCIHLSGRITVSRKVTVK